MASEVYTAASGARVTVMNEEVPLAAIGAGVSGTWDMENSVATYLAVRAWMFSKNTDDLKEVMLNFKYEVIDFEDYLKENHYTLPKSVTSDISMTWQWVKKSGFRPGSIMDSKTISFIAKKLLETDFGVRVPTTLTTARPIPYRAVKDSLTGVKSIEYGKVSDYLFTRTRVRNVGRISQEQYEQMNRDAEYMGTLNLYNR
jgi:hypothetical protein